MYVHVCLFFVIVPTCMLHKEILEERLRKVDFFFDAKCFENIFLPYNISHVLYYLLDSLGRWMLHSEDGFQG